MGEDNNEESFENSNVVEGETPQAEGDPADVSAAEPAQASADGEDNVAAAEPAQTDEAPAANAAPADAAAEDFAEAANVPGALHTAASQGKVDAVAFLLRQKVDIETVDSEGKTALQVAVAAGQAEVAQLLRENGAKEPEAPAPPPPAAPAEAEASKPAQEEPAEPAKAARPDSLDELQESMQGTPMDQVGDPFQEKKQSPNSRVKKGMSSTTSAMGSYADLKAKTSFSGATDKGVLKRSTYMTAFSSFRSSPKYTLGQKGNNMFIRSSSTPAPGTYNLPPENRNKFKAEPRYSFGGNSRFGMGENPSKIQPGPGQYDPVDPLLVMTKKVGFGTSVRNRGNMSAQGAPGPGAYEYRSCMGQGQMFTAGGRHPTSYMRARSLPGPGAYNPSVNVTMPSQTKCGFGTSTRDDLGGRGGVQPGPGTYEMQNFKGVGADAPKFSATSRRKVHDLDSYLTPGPGTYNAHVTSFGY